MTPCVVGRVGTEHAQTGGRGVSSFHGGFPNILNINPPYQSPANSTWWDKVPATPPRSLLSPDDNRLEAPLRRRKEHGHAWLLIAMATGRRRSGDAFEGRGYHPWCNLCVFHMSDAKRAGWRRLQASPKARRLQSDGGGDGGDPSDTIRRY